MTGKEVVRQFSDVIERAGRKWVRCSCGHESALGPFTSRHAGVQRVGGECSACKARITIEPRPVS